jgi:hypothetical protein
MEFTETIDFAKIIKEIEKKAVEALALAAQAVCEDVKSSGTMPFETGRLQNSATYVDVGGLKNKVAAVVSDVPYASRVYLHPEISFNQSRNKNAGGRWFDAYVKGDKKDFLLKVFAEAMGD